MKSWMGFLVVLFACQTQQQQMPVRDIAAISPESSTVSAKLVPDPNAPQVQLGAGEEFVRPALNPSNTPPQYPQQLASLHLAPHTVGVRVTFNESGKVIDVASSPLIASTDDPYRAAFAAAVQDAVREWKCYPPRIRKFRPGPDIDADGKSDYRILDAERVLKTFFDLSFTFEIVNGQPVVKSGG